MQEQRAQTSPDPVLRRSSLAALGVVLLSAGACGSDPEPGWQVVHRHLDSALLSVWGTSSTDVWAVGSDSGEGPLVLHFDGAGWERLETGQVGDLWWVFGFPGGPIYLGGAGGLILRYEAGAFTRMTTPGVDTVFGIWGASPTDLWAVGGGAGGSQGAFAWRLEGDSWSLAPGFPEALAANGALWKVYGRSASDVWLVGTNGTVVRWDGSSLTHSTASTGESLFTVHANDAHFAAVGGFGTGLIFENDGGGWKNVSPAGAPSLIGVSLTAAGGYATGEYGSIFRRGDAGWELEDTGLTLGESLHSVWVDDEGGVWSVGGEVSTTPLQDGVLLHKGDSVSGGIE